MGAAELLELLEERCAAETLLQVSGLLKQGSYFLQNKFSWNLTLFTLENFSNVSLSKVAAYCSPLCQQEDWRIHEERLVLRMLLFFVFHL